MNEHDKIMTENLTKRFIGHCGIGLAGRLSPNSRLNHAESGSDIRRLVIVLQELRLFELEVVIQLRRVADLSRTPSPRDIAAADG